MSLEPVTIGTPTAPDAKPSPTAEEADAGSLFATIYAALGLDPNKNYYVGARPIPLVNPERPSGVRCSGTGS